LEEDTILSEDEKEYQEEYNKIFGDDQEIEDIILHKEKDSIMSKSIKTSQEGEKSQKVKDNIQRKFGH
jgi:hypothetical protein